MKILLFDQFFASSLLVFLIAFALWESHSWLREWRGLGLGSVALIALLGLAYRLLLVKPAIVHGDWQGTLIVQGVLDFPEPSGIGDGNYGANYGQGSFIVLGLLSKFLGEDPAGVLRSNVVVSALITFPVAFLGARWGGSRLSGLLAAGIWAGSGLVGRLSHSEDAHLVGLLFGLIALAFAERLKSRQILLTLLGLCLSALLAAWSRETSYAFAPIALLLFAENLLRERYPIPHKYSPPHKRKLFWMWWLLACGIVLALLLFRVLRSYGHTNLYGWLIEDMVRDPMLTVGLIIDHPLFSFRRLSPVVGVFGLIGVVLLGWHRRRFSIIAGFLLYAVLTLPAGSPYVGMSWSFRLPFYTLAIICAGGALAHGFEWIQNRFVEKPSWLTRPAGEGAFIALVVAAGLMGTVTLENLQDNAEFVEYEFFWNATASLPEDSVLITGWLEHRFPIEAVARGRKLSTARLSELPDAPLSENWFFPVGQGAWAYTFSEVAQVSDEEYEHVGGERMPVALRPFIISMWDRRQGYGAAYFKERPIGMRPEFKSLLARSELVEKGPQLLVHDTIPHALFSLRELQVGLYRWVE